MELGISDKLFVCISKLIINVKACILQSLRHGDRIGLSYLTAAGTTDISVVGSIAQDGHSLFGQREGVVVVLKQHDTLLCNLPCHQGMRFQVGIVRSSNLFIGRTFDDELQDALHILVDVSFGDLSFLHGSLYLLYLGFSSGHEQIVSGLELGCIVASGEPVGHHHAFEAPLIAQHAGEQPGTLGAVSSVNLVVCTHHCPGLRLLDGNLEATEEDLT